MVLKSPFRRVNLGNLLLLKSRWRAGRGETTERWHLFVLAMKALRR